MRNAVYSALIGLALAVFSTVADAQSHATVVLKPHALIERDAIRLADVADIQTTDVALQQLLSEILLGETSVSNARVYGRGTIAMRIKQSTANPIDIAWQGAERVAVERQAQIVEGELLATAAREYLSRSLRELDPTLTRVDVSMSEQIEPLRLPTGSVSVIPRAIRSATLSKRTCVWLDITVDGQVRRHVPVWLTVSAYKPVRVTTRTFTVREPVTNSDFLVEERDVTDMARGAMSSIQDVSGWRAHRLLSTGVVVQVGDLEARPAVARDQEVRVQVASGAILLETRAVAEQEGKIGDDIRLRNASSDATYLGRVTGIGQVFVSAR